jgi:hypothetical protein
VQKSRVYTVTEMLDEKLAGAIKEFLRNNKALPERIVMFRDGVSEGEYEKVCRVSFSFKQFSGRRRRAAGSASSLH